MITVNQYLKLIQKFFKKHKQMNTVLVGDDYDFNQNPNIIYPVTNIEYVRQNIGSDSIVDTFEITIADLFDPNIKKSEYKIYSDSALIASDCTSYFYNQYDADYDLGESVDVKNWKGNVDRLAGVVFSINFSQYRENNACIIPLN